MQPQDGGVERDVCDKLLMLCDMFGVTLDDLVMGDVCASAGRGGAGRVGPWRCGTRGAVWMRDAWTWLPIRLVWQRRMGWLTLLLVRFRG